MATVKLLQRTCTVKFNNESLGVEVDTLEKGVEIDVIDDERHATCSRLWITRDGWIFPKDRAYWMRP